MEVDDASILPDNTVVNIAADGDAIMVVGPKKKEFRLHSLFLKATSKVFKAMLGPNFAEGQRLIANDANGRGDREPVKIDLPRDDAEGMEFIFRAIHHQFDAFDNPKDFPFFEILVAADKYDLHPPIKYAFRHALATAVEKEETLKQMCCEGLWKLAMAAAFVTNDRAFKAATRALILYYDERYLGYAQQWFLNEVFALRVCAALEEERSSWKDRVMVELLNVCHSSVDSLMYTVGIKGSEAFIYSSLSDQLDVLHFLEERLEYHIQVDGNYWMDDLKENSGFDLDRFA